MFVGHLAAAMVAKRIEPQISLGTAVLAAWLSDTLLGPFWIAGLDQMRYGSGRGAANYLVVTHVAWSHSLLTNALWGALLAGTYLWRRRYRRGAIVLFATVLSHWVLDWISHPPDMQLAPGLEHRFGLGLWTSVPATIVVEGGFWLLGIVLYLRATRPANRWGIYVFWIVAAFLTLAWYNNIAGPPPPNIPAAPFIGLVFSLLMVAWAYWMNRLRPTRDARQPA